MRPARLLSVFSVLSAASVSFVLMGLLPPAAAAPAKAADLWWRYMARYDKGVGVVNADLALRQRAPLADYPFLVITGSTYKTNIINPLPDKKEIARLKELEAQELAVIRAAGPIVYAGNLAYAGEYTHYVYAQKVDGVKEALDKLYAGPAQVCKKCRNFTVIKEDKDWRIYQKFLYPNPQTRNFYRGQLTKLGIPIEQ
jgi:hypothetical protein